jgi:hypothetical protein
MKKATPKKLKQLTRPRKSATCCSPQPEAAAQCCAKASRLVAGCHD